MIIKYVFSIHRAGTNTSITINYGNNMWYNCQKRNNMWYPSPIIRHDHTRLRYIGIRK